MKIFSIFSTNVKKKTRHEVSNANEYYETLARRTSITKYIVLFLLIVFVVFGFTFFSDRLTADNFKYMFKFMSIDIDAEIPDGSFIEYNASEKVKAIIMNGDLAVVDISGVQTFDLSGVRFLKATERREEPMSVSSGDHLVVCDFGGTQLSIYTVYASFFTQSFDYPVYGLCGSDSGHYAVLTAAQGYRSGIEVYDEHTRIVYSYYFADKYISSIGISSDGSKAAACTVDNTEDGSFLGQMYVFDTTQKNKFVCFDYLNELPLKVYFRSDGYYNIITDTALRVYSPDNTLIKQTSFEARATKNLAFSDTYSSVAFSNAGISNSSIVSFYGSDGSNVGEMRFKNDISSINIIGDYAYIYSVGNLYTVHIPTNTEIRKDEVGTDYVSVLHAASNDKLIFIFHDKAVFYGKNNYNN